MKRSALKQLLETFLAIESGIERVKEKDLKELLSTITDLELLAQLWKKASANSQSEKLIKARMKELLQEILPTITDLDQLVQFLEDIPPNSKLQQLIEARIKVILAGINDLDQLIQCSRKIFHLITELDEPLDARIVKVLKKKLPTITDINQLIRYSGGTLPTSEWEELIEARIEKLIKSVSPDNLPDWFGEMLRNPSKIPKYFKGDVTSKAKEILAQL